MTLKVCVVDDHQVFLEGLAALLSSSRTANNAPCCVTTFSSPIEFLDELDAGLQVDVVISDLIMREMNGLAFVQAIRKRDMKLPVLVLSGIDTQPPYVHLKSAGANGFIHKSQDCESILEGISSIVAAPATFYLPDRLRAVFDQDAAVKEGVINLSDRQVDVLLMVEQGLSNKEIATNLNISESTVKTHLRNMYSLLNVRTRTACLQKAKSFGFV